MFFNHPGRGSRKSPVDLAAEKYKNSKSEADLEALKAAILANYERMLETVPPHNAEQEKALAAAEARLNALRQKQHSPAPAGKMKFSDPEAQAQEDKINRLAAAFRQSRDPKQLEELRKEVTPPAGARYADHAPPALPKRSANSPGCREHLEEFTKDPDAVIRSRHRRFNPITTGACHETIFHPY